jgi:hypothetical protein
MKKTAAALSKLGICAEEVSLPDSAKRFPDGAQYRIEIPSVESPEALSAILEEADKQKVLVHRASQGSGIMMLTDAELTRMLKIAKDAKMELSLFVGPRAGFDTTPQPFTAAGKVIGGSLRGGSQLVYAVEDVKRGCALGLRSVLVADLGLLWILGELKRSGELPANLVLKISILLSVPNPATAHVLESLGAGTINVSPDLSLGQLSTMRGAVAAPLDIYVEVPDGFGGYIRTFEVPEMIRVASPVYIKLGLRNAPDIYPYGEQLRNVALAMSRERVHRARLVLDLIHRYAPGMVMSKAGGQGLGVPEC